MSLLFCSNTSTYLKDKIVVQNICSVCRTIGPTPALVSKWEHWTLDDECYYQESRLKRAWLLPSSWWPTIKVYHSKTPTITCPVILFQLEMCWTWAVVRGTSWMSNTQVWAAAVIYLTGVVSRLTRCMENQQIHYVIKLILDLDAV